MKVVIQRCKCGSCTVDDKIVEAMKNKQDLLEYLLETKK